MMNITQSGTKINETLSLPTSSLAQLLLLATSAASPSRKTVVMMHIYILLYILFKIKKACLKFVIKCF